LRTIQDCQASLTPREREIMALVGSGLLNKQIATELRISEDTVKAHRGHMSHRFSAAMIKFPDNDPHLDLGGRGAIAPAGRRVPLVSLQCEPAAGREGNIVSWYGINTDIARCELEHLTFSGSLGMENEKVAPGPSLGSAQRWP